MDVTALDRIVRGLATADQGSPWLRALREQALHRFAASDGLPGTSQEDWRYTDLAPVARLVEALASAPRPVGGRGEGLRRPLPGTGAGFLAVVVDGVLRPDLSNLPARPGLSVAALSQAADSHRAALEGQLANSLAGDAGGLADFKTALMRDALAIHVMEGVAIGEPIHVVIAGSGGDVSHNHLMIRLGPGSSATVIEHHLGAAAGLSGCTTGITCEAAARLSFIRIQELDDSACHLGAQRIDAAHEAQVDLLHLDLGARLARNDLRVDLAAPGAAVAAHGLFFADGSRHLDNHTRIDHLAPRTRSRELYRGIMDGSGRGVFNGRVIVHPGADKADAQLRNQNLLLSKSAEIDTKPELEIYADDVKCSHGATTGQLDRNSVFYLRSRGIPEEQARRLLIASFAREIVMRLPAGPTADHVVAVLGDRLPGLIEAGERP